MKIALLIYSIIAVYQIIRLNDELKDANYLDQFVCLLEIIFWPVVLIIVLMQKENIRITMLIINIIFLIAVTLFAGFWMYASIYDIMKYAPYFAGIGIFLSIVTFVAIINYVKIIVKNYHDNK